MQTFIPLFGEEYKRDTGHEAITDDILDIEYVEWIEDKVNEMYGNQKRGDANIQPLIEYQKDYWFPVPHHPVRKFIIPVGNKTEAEIKQSLSDLLSSYREDIDFKGQLEINFDGPIISDEDKYKNDIREALEDTR